MMRFMMTLLAALTLWAMPVLAQGNGPLRIEITEGVIEPLPFAVPDFVSDSAAGQELGRNIASVIAADLNGTGLFRQIPSSAHISRITSFESPVQYADWRAINAQALITGAVSTDGAGRIIAKFRIYDVFSGQELGAGQQLVGTQDGWRRIAHKVADQVYSRITGEGGYFDSRVVFVAESGPKDQRAKRLGIMDYDGANVQYLTDSTSIVLAPRFSPNGRTVVYSLTQGGNTDLYTMDIGSGASTRLTTAPSIETAPSYSPDGSQIVFESDRSGTPQLYIMSAGGGEARRISFGEGRYGTPVWSPRGDLVAFTTQSKGSFHIGVMRTDGSEERLLTASFLDEGPTWAPNGRVIMFTRETQGEQGQASLYSVDITGRNLKQVPTNTGASDPSWSPLQN